MSSNHLLPRIHRLSGWGRLDPRKVPVLRPERVADLQLSESFCLPRGAGCSYGDASLPAQGAALSTHCLDRFLAFDAHSGVLAAEAGLTLARILAFIVPQGWFLPVTPGTKYATLGGALASDVHGKNHHSVGSLSTFVEWLDLSTPGKGLLRCSREKDPELFWATLGGMGLTGTILAASIRLLRISTDEVIVRHQGAPDLDSCLTQLEDPANEAPYSVAWIDGLAQGRTLGRSVVMTGRHAEDEAGKSLLRPPPDSPRLTIPFTAPPWLLSGPMVGSFNYFYRWFQLRKKVPFRVPLDTYFYPLDGLGNWNRLYGKRGFVQYQCVLPFDTARAFLCQLLTLMGNHHQRPYLVVLKKMGPGSLGYLSFPMAGYTIAMDLPYSGPRTRRLASQLDALVLAAGGRVNLTKDALLSSDTFHSMYPRFEAWREVKNRVDPNWLIESALSRRLGWKR